MKVAELVALAQRSKDPLVLRDLARQPSKRVRIAVAENRAASDDTVTRLLGDGESLVRLAAAATNLAPRPAVQEVAALSRDDTVRAILADTFADDHQRSLALAVQSALAVDPSAEVRGRVASTTDQPTLFETLLRDDAIVVRASCASNPRINRLQTDRLVSDRRAEVRAAAAGNGLRYPDDEQLLRLSGDRSAAVRWAVLFRVDRPRAAVERIAEDPDEWNRHHAQRALQSESLINSPAVVRTARAERARARSVPEFPSAAPQEDGTASGPTRSSSQVQAVAAIEMLLSSHLVPLGYRKSRKRWLRTTADFSTALVLLRSRYGGRSFIDVEIRFDLSSSVPDVMTRLDVWADDDRSLEAMLVDENPGLEQEFGAYLTERIVPLLRTLSVEYLRTPDGHLLLDGALLSTRAGERFAY